MLDNLTYSNRRSFLKKACNLFALIGLFITTGMYFLFAFPKKIRKKKTVYVYACGEEELPVQGVRQYFVNYALHGKPVTSKIFIVNTGKELFALSSICTHLGCFINWYRPANRFLCPCHGGEYDITGNVVEGPPPASLNRLSLKIEHQKAYIGIKI
jgi:cytochrome b6-f complex iron-sulfur subunit